MKDRQIIFLAIFIILGLYLLSNSHQIYQDPFTGASTAYNSICINSTFPSKMYVNEGRVVTITVENEGRKTWNQDYYLDSKNFPKNLWGIERIYLDKEVKPNEIYEFKFEITAPSTVEFYRSDWQLFGPSKYKDINFGEVCKNQIEIIDIGDCIPSKEICDGIDNDCDNYIDENVKNACGYCGPVPKEVCNGIDDDCDTLIDEDCLGLCIDNDNDGYCTDTDCNDNNPLINPAAEELCDDTEDNNCNGQINEICSPKEYPLKTSHPINYNDVEIILIKVYWDKSALFYINENYIEFKLHQVKPVRGFEILLMNTTYNIFQKYQKATIKIID